MPDERRQNDDPEKFVVSDPDGVFLTLDPREAQAIYDELRDDDDLSENLMALRDQLAEFCS